MNRYKKVFVAGALTVGIGAGAVLFTPAGMNANTNVVLASVDWVNSKLNPVNTKLTSLQSQINALETKNTAQQKEIDSLKAQIDSKTPPTTTNPAPSTNLPSYVYTTKSTVKIHSGALRTYKVVATKSKGASLKVVSSFKSTSGLWYRVKVTSTVYGWIYSGDVSTTKSTASSTTSPTKVITTANVNLRKGATVAYDKIATISKGTTLKYIQSFKNSNGDTWYNVQTSSGLKGWMVGSFGQVK
jgi:uncharacterized protein YgiM (DUF1202 family)